MKLIDVEGLPEPIAQALEIVVHALRTQYAAPPEKPTHEPRELVVWPGKVLSDLTREDIYGDIR